MFLSRNFVLGKQLRGLKLMLHQKKRNWEARTLFQKQLVTEYMLPTVDALLAINPNKMSYFNFPLKYLHHILFLVK